jgi:hypothetical protein
MGQHNQPCVLIARLEDRGISSKEERHNPIDVLGR